MPEPTHYRYILIDRPILDASTGLRGQVPVPPNSLWIIPTRTVGQGKACRHYYAGLPPLRMLIVFRCPDTMAQLAEGVYAKVLIGWDPGISLYTLNALHGLTHTKISVDEVVTEPPADADILLLGEVLARVPLVPSEG